MSLELAHNGSGKVEAGNAPVKVPGDEAKKLPPVVLRSTEVAATCSEVIPNLFTCSDKGGREVLGPGRVAPKVVAGRLVFVVGAKHGRREIPVERVVSTAPKPFSETFQVR